MYGRRITKCPEKDAAGSEEALFLWIIRLNRQNKQKEKKKTWILTKIFVIFYKFLKKILEIFFIFSYNVHNKQIPHVEKASGKVRRKKKSAMKGVKKLKHFWALYLLMLPGFAYLIINNYIPMTGIIIAFKKYNVNYGIYRSPWNGLNNFKFLVSNDLALILRNTILYNLVFIALGLVASVSLAIMISDIVNPTAKKIYQSFVMMPFLISMVIVSYIVYAFMSGDNGLINKTFREPFGLQKITWYSYPKPWPFILVFVHLWKGAGYGTLIYIAGIAGIDKELYEAARIDGASRWKQIKAITLPHLIPSMITLTMLSIGRIFYSDFGLFYQVPQNSGALFSVTQTIDTYVYRALIQVGGIGKSAAAGFFQSVVGFLFVMGSNLLVRKISPDNAMF